MAQPQYNPQAAPAQYPGMSYQTSAPAYVTQSGAQAVPQNTVTSVAGCAAGSVMKAAGTAASAAMTQGSKLMSHAAAGGVTNILSTAGGKINYLGNMIRAGGTSSYWRKMFTVPKEEKLIETYACHMQAQGNQKVPGILFIGTLSLAYCSDEPIGANGYLQMHLPLERVHSFQPSQRGTTFGKEEWLGAIMLDGYQFWFTGFIDFQKSIATLVEAANQYRSGVVVQGTPVKG